MRKLLWDAIYQACSWVLGISGCKWSSSLNKKKALYCGLWSFNAHYWKASHSLRLILTGVGIFAVFEALGFGYRRIGGVSEAGHTSITLLALVLQYWCSQFETTIHYEYVHSVSVDRCVGIANLMARLESWISNILKDKSVEELRCVLNSFPGLGW